MGSSDVGPANRARQRPAWLGNPKVIVQAAEYWAVVRRAGQPTADPKELDADAILAAQASRAGDPGDEVLIATTNTGHLARFPGISARSWEQIR